MLNTSHKYTPLDDNSGVNSFPFPHHYISYFPEVSYIYSVHVKNIGEGLRVINNSLLRLNRLNELRNL